MIKLFPLWTIACVILLTGCVQDMYMSPTHYPACVECFLTNEDVQHLSLFRAGTLSDSLLSPILDAEICISIKSSEGSTEEKYAFSYEGEGLWASSFRPVSGQEYKLDIKLHSGERLSSKLVFPDSLSIESLFVQSYFDNVLKVGNVGPLGGDLDFSSNQSYYDSVHEAGMLDISEVMSRHLFRINGGEIDNLVVTSQTDNCYFATSLPGVTQLNVTSHCVYFSQGEESDIPWYTCDEEDGADIGGGTLLNEWLKLFEGSPIYDGFCLLPVKTDYRNTTVPNLTNIFKSSMLYPRAYSDWSTPMDDFNRFFNVLKLKHVVNDVDKFCPSSSYDDLIFLNVTDDLVNYSSIVYEQIMHPNRMSTDVINKLYQGTSIYTNITGGYGVFGAYTKNSHKCFVR